jgi:hypothetical protein
MPNAILKELVDATGVKKRVSEKTEAHLERLHDAILALEEDKWEALSKEAQDWTNATTDKRQANEPFGPPEGDDDDSDNEAAAASADNDEDEGESDVTTESTETKEPKAATSAPAKKKAAKPASKAKAPAKKASAEKKAAPKKAVKKANGAAREVSAQETMKILLAKDPSLSVDDITQKLKDKGLKAPTRTAVSSIRSSFRNSMKVLNKLGFLKGVEI